jgi:hypothetical protein
LDSLRKQGLDVCPFLFIKEIVDSLTRANTFVEESHSKKIEGAYMPISLYQGMGPPGYVYMAYLTLFGPVSSIKRIGIPF